MGSVQPHNISAYTLKFRNQKRERTVDRRIIQLIAALNNSRSRERFAAICLSSSGIDPEPVDRVLLQAGVITVGPKGVVINLEGLHTLLEASREIGNHAGSPPLDRLPGKPSKRHALLTRLADEIFLERDEAISERTLGERLSTRVGDVALFRRALVDNGYVERDPSGHSYRAVLRKDAGASQ